MAQISGPSLNHRVRSLIAGLTLGAGIALPAAGAVRQARASGASGMIPRLLPPFAKKPIWRLLKQRADKKVAELYAGKDYLDGYIAHTNQRVAEDPKAAVGGMWDEIGSLQFEFLIKQGMLPEHRMLDLGCGTLRGGRHFIRYLNTSNYTGVDISPACLDAAHKLLKEEQLLTKNPALIMNTNKNMKFAECESEIFDFILAQSVFTHLPQEFIYECFENIGKCMHEDSNFYFTYLPAESIKRADIKTFFYPWIFFEKLAADCGFEIAEVSNLYPHPRGQKMGLVRKA
jgi:SAM-dependent methyltransferase